MFPEFFHPPRPRWVVTVTRAWHLQLLTPALLANSTVQTMPTAHLHTDRPADGGPGDLWADRKLHWGPGGGGIGQRERGCCTGTVTSDPPAPWALLQVVPDSLTVWPWTDDSLSLGLSLSTCKLHCRGPVALSPGRALG